MLRLMVKLCNDYKQQSSLESTCKHLPSLEQNFQVRTKRDASIDQRCQVQIDLKSQSHRDERAVLVAGGSDPLQLNQPAKSTRLGSQRLTTMIDRMIETICAQRAPATLRLTLMLPQAVTAASR